MKSKMNFLTKKNKKGQLFALEAKDFSIGFLIGAVVTIIVLAILIKTGKIPFSLIEKLQPVIPKK